MCQERKGGDGTRKFEKHCELVEQFSLYFRHLSHFVQLSTARNDTSYFILKMFSQVPVSVAFKIL